MKAPFDEPASLYINEARAQTLSNLLADTGADGKPRTGLDVGCGFGYFTDRLADGGLEATGIDGRAENVAEAARRHPHLKFEVWNVEDPALAEFGKFDFVSSFGLLYHLENPLAAIRNLAALARDVLVVESVVVPYREPAAVLYEEDEDVDQGLTYLALIPSESWLVKAFYVAGFGHVYRAAPLPDHPDFRAGAGKRRRRTVLAASRTPLTGRLEAVAEPRTRRHLWDALPLPGLESPRVRSAVQRLRRLTRTR